MGWVVWDEGLRVCDINWKPKLVDEWQMGVILNLNRPVFTLYY